VATTTEGRDLTNAHRIQQVIIGQDTQQEATLLTDTYLTTPAPDRTAWLAAMLLMASSRWRQSQRLAAAYLHEFDHAENAPVGGSVVELRFPDARAVTMLTDLIPAPLVAELEEPLEQELVRTVAAEAGKLAMTGGRSTIDLTSRRRRVRYRRVSDGNPCAFCAMLAQSGPRYSEETAYFRAHPDCGCTAEPVYGIWQPTALERKWVDAYDDAAEAARKAGEPLLAPHGRQRRDTILWRMRRLHPELFSDGIYPKAA